jgi:multiple sugar transport system substrate-binding protein
MVELQGMTWNHTRGYLPMVATAQRFSELNPGVTIRWEKRSLQEFADFGLERLVDKFDLLVIDHPFAGYAAAHGVLLPLDRYLPAEFLADQAAHSVGQSNASYIYGGHQWGLATDAATPISGYRADLLEKAGLKPPATWNELLDLAERSLVAVSGIAIDTLCHFFMICTGLGEEPFIREDAVVSEDTGVQGLNLLRELMRLVVPGCDKRNPIAVWELLTSTDVAAYCPFAYGYSNYGRPRYARHPLQFGGLVTMPNGLQCRSTLGGAGLAISSRSKEIGVAVDYSAFVASAGCQSGLYFDSGGQPGHRAAWVDERVNRESNNFFRDTLPTLNEAWLRPRWDGYIQFQEEAAEIVHKYVWHGGDAWGTLQELNQLTQRTRKEAIV